MTTILCLIVIVLSAGSAFAQTDSVPPTGATVTPVQSLPTDRQNDHYLNFRPPLLANPLLKLPIGDITPRGWLRTQLQLAADGMTGHLPKWSHWCQFETSAWADAQGQGENPWEELPYWLKGYGDLGYVLQDERIIAETRRWIDAVLASQRPDGYFGPEQNRVKHDLWPNMVMLNVLQSYHEATGDQRVFDCLTRYFQWEAALPDDQFLPGSWQKVRAGDNLESVYWLYNRTGDPSLLEFAHRLHQRTVRWDEGVANWHGVNICQGFREPAVYYVQTKNPQHLAAAERNYQAVMERYGQVPGGMFGADENCREGRGDPRQAAEMCSMVELLHSFELLLTFTGDPLFADRCEEVAFNSLPAAYTPDLKGIHYLTAPNCPQLDKANHAPGVENKGCMFAYSPDKRYRCCQHNIAHGWPYFAEHLWMATRDNGLAAVLYAPCEVKATVADGTAVTITEQTDYPFDETITLKIGVAQPTAFPLYLRRPEWCGAPQVRLNGDSVTWDSDKPARYLKVQRTWSDGDELTLVLPMSVSVKRWQKNANSASVRRGPLWYSLKIAERWEPSGGTPDWPQEWQVFPDSPWNYGLVLDDHDPAASFRLVRGDGLLPDQPFALEVPIALIAKARRIPQWQFDETGLVQPLQPSPVKSEASEQEAPERVKPDAREQAVPEQEASDQEVPGQVTPDEEVVLIPMGAARLRISAFPVIGAGPDAQEWQAPQSP